MSAPLRWTAALAAVGVLGFAADRYLGTTEEFQPSQFTFPVVVPDGSARSASIPVVAGQRPVPRTLHEILKLHDDARRRRFSTSDTQSWILKQRSST